MCVCMCVCMCMHVCACVCMCVHVCVCVCVCVCVIDNIAYLFEPMDIIGGQVDDMANRCVPNCDMIEIQNLKKMLQLFNLLYNGESRMVKHCKYMHP